jgi:hypothetical protein
MCSQKYQLNIFTSSFVYQQNQTIQKIIAPLAARDFCLFLCKTAIFKLKALKIDF